MMEDGRWRLEVVAVYCPAVCGGVTDDQLTAGRCGVRTLLLISQQQSREQRAAKQRQAQQVSCVLVTQCQPGPGHSDYNAQSYHFRMSYLT